MSGVRRYVELLASSRRIQGMRAGLREAIRPGDRVLEIGTGLGTYALFAAEAGAERVVAVDRDPIVHVAESAAAAAGMAERIAFVRGSFPEVAFGTGVSPRFPFDTPFDVVVFEDYPGLLMDGDTHALLEATSRLLAEGGRIVPGRARLAVVPVEYAELARRLVPAPEVFEGTHLDPDLVRGFAAHEPLRTTLPVGCHVTPPLVGDPVPILPAPDASELRLHGRLRVGRPATVHALVAWFDLEVAEGVWVSNGPVSPSGGEAPEPWGQFALPVHPPLVLAPGAELEVRAGPAGAAGEVPGAWLWELRSGVDQRLGDETAGRPIGPPDLGV